MKDERFGRCIGGVQYCVAHIIILPEREHLEPAKSQAHEMLGSLPDIAADHEPPLLGLLSVAAPAPALAPASADDGAG